MTMIIAIVSPRARPTPRMMAATMPDRAAGTVTPTIVCHRVAPSASDPSRYSLGTARMASSAMFVMVGSTITARTTDAEASPKPVLPGMEKRLRVRGTNTTMPNRPYTTEGMPASNSTAGRTTART